MKQDELDYRMAWIDQELQRLYAERRELLGQTEVTCGQTYNPRGGCGTIHQIKDLTFVQTYYWDGCEAWRGGEAEFDCPECGLRNRLIDEHKGQKRAHIARLSPYFKDAVRRED